VFGVHRRDRPKNEVEDTNYNRDWLIPFVRSNCVVWNMVDCVFGVHRRLKGTT